MNGRGVAWVIGEGVGEQRSLESVEVYIDPVYPRRVREGPRRSPEGSI